MNETQRARAVQRLRADRGRTLAKSFSCGQCEGKQYVVAVAGYHEVSALVRLHDEGGYDLWDRLVGVMGEDSYRVEDSVIELNLDRDEYAQAFLEGVAEAWAEIEDAVEADDPMTQ